MVAKPEQLAAKTQPESGSLAMFLESLQRKMQQRCRGHQKETGLTSKAKRSLY